MNAHGKRIIIFSMITLAVLSSIPLGYSESKSIQPLVDVRPYDTQRLSIDVRFIDVVGQTIEHVNYSISVKYNSQLILEDSGVHNHMGQTQHITAPVHDPDSGTVDITITFEGIGIDEPFGGPIGKVYEIKKILGTKVNPDDKTPPLIIVPDSISKTPDNSMGAIVYYTPRAIDETDGVIDVVCRPSPGSVFPIGRTVVNCSAADVSGNKAEKSFTITVEQKTHIPDWIRNVASFWCNDEIDDAGFAEAIQYLVNNNVIIIKPDHSDTKETESIPAWIKNNACWWSSDLIPDEDFARGLEFLMQNRIIKVG